MAGAECGRQANLLKLDRNFDNLPNDDSDPGFTQPIRVIDGNEPAFIEEDQVVA
jgi:hypothetical protein